MNDLIVDRSNEIEELQNIINQMMWIINQKVEKFILSVTEPAPEPTPDPTVLATPKPGKAQTTKYPFIMGKVSE